MVTRRNGAFVLALLLLGLFIVAGLNWRTLSLNYIATKLSKSSLRNELRKIQTWRLLFVIISAVRL